MKNMINRHHQWLRISTIGLIMLGGSAFAANPNTQRQVFRGTIERIDWKGKTLRIRVPGCEEDSIKTYSASNRILLSKAEEGDVVAVSVSGAEPVLQEIEVLSPMEGALGFLLLCRGNRAAEQR
jgi:hypothetical protein